MKILWITNTIFPEAAKNLGISTPVAGGWMYSLAEYLAKQPGIELAVATVYSDRELKIFDAAGVRYYLLPCRNSLKYEDQLESYWNIICNSFKPGIVHVHGTEYPHGLACMNKHPELTYVISIQGILSIYERYYLGGISTTDIFKNITFRDIVRMDTLFQAQNEMRKRSVWKKILYGKPNTLSGELIGTKYMRRY